MQSGRHEHALRVLHVRRVFSTLSQTFVYQTALEMERLGVDSRVLCLLRTRARTRPHPTHALLGPPEWAHGSDGLLGSLFAHLRVDRLDRRLWPLHQRWMRRHLARLRPDVILAHFGPDACLVAPVARALGVPLAAVFYGYDVSRLLCEDEALWRGRYAELWPRCDLVLGISSHVVQRLRALGAPEQRLRLWHLGADLDRIAYRDPGDDADGQRVHCLHVGRLTAKKGPLELLRAFARARELTWPRVDLRLHVAGDGELAGACRREIARLGVAEHVRLWGAVPHETVLELLGRAHVYVQHCRTAPNGDMEGLGVSFVEAAAAGLPIVATRHDGIPDVVLHGRTGLLSPEGDVEAMARNLATLAVEPKWWSELGRRGRRHVESEFSLETTVSALLDWLRAISTPRPVPDT